ncbi:MAG: hypothetical protein PHC94_09830, partial [Methylobacter sp.]|nr:hypothetical protein [Methylobacter sp.]
TVIMSAIAAASVQQTFGIDQVNQAIGQMDDVTQQNAALVEQAAASAESLEEQTQNLTATIRQFKVDTQNDGQAIIKRSSAISGASLYEPIMGKLQPQKIVAGEEWEEF